MSEEQPLCVILRWKDGGLATLKGPNGATATFLDREEAYRAFKLMKLDELVEECDIRPYFNLNDAEIREMWMSAEAWYHSKCETCERPMSEHDVMGGCCAAVAKERERICATIKSGLTLEESADLKFCEEHGTRLPCVWCWR